jgi:hypothetical protein
MIPEFNAKDKLRAGEHEATWTEVVQRLGFSPKRKALLEGLLRVARELAARGAIVLFIDGSFVTRKRNPSDFDCCYELQGLDFDSLPPVFRDLASPRTAQKNEYGGEFLPASAIARHIPPQPPEPYRTFFAHDKAGNPKGIVALDLRTLPDDQVDEAIHNDQETDG